VLSQVPAPGIMFQLLTASALAVVAFGINRRSLEFFHIRGIGWLDIASAILAVATIVSLLILAAPVIQHFDGLATTAPESNDDDNPLWFALVTAVSAGVFEEFIYRGFVIEELGERIHSRGAAAVVSIVFFALAHFGTYGWSVQLIKPGLAGLVLTGLYFSRRNLPVCMLLHAAIDSVHALRS